MWVVNPGPKPRIVESYEFLAGQADGLSGGSRSGAGTSRTDQAP